MRVRWPSFRQTALPGALLAIQIVQGIWRGLDYISRGDTLVRLVSYLPDSLQLITHPLTGIFLTIGGFLWLWWVAREHPKKAILLDGRAKPVASTNRSPLKVAAAAALFAVAIAISTWFGMRYYLTHTVAKALPGSPTLVQKTPPIFCTSHFYSRS